MNPVMAASSDSAKTPKQAAAKRRAEALRANLRRRKEAPTPPPAVAPTSTKPSDSA